MGGLMFPKPCKARRNDRKARIECVAIVVARDQVCQWPVLAAAYLVDHPDEQPQFDRFARCGQGPLTAHEPHHSRNVGRINPDMSIASCWFHNGVAEADGRALAERIGFIKRGNFLPLRKGIAS